MANNSVLTFSDDKILSFPQPGGTSVSAQQLSRVFRHVNRFRVAVAFHSGRDINRVSEELKSRTSQSEFRALDRTAGLGTNDPNDSTNLEATLISS